MKKSSRPTIRKSATTIAGRINAIDIFRGLTILTMIFVNDLASVRDVPWWMKHMPQAQDGMTFVDVVFPAFLFIVGMSIPFAIDRRIQGAVPRWSAIPHILIRTAGLLALGVLMVNIHGLNAAATGMDSHWWAALVFVSAILVWNRYSSATPRARMTGMILRSVGAVGLVVLVAIYRGGPDNNLHWLLTSWWGILGLIGWAYAASSFAYLAFRKSLPALAGMLALFVLLYGADKGGAFACLPWVRDYLWIGGQIGAHSSITMAGVILSVILQQTQSKGLRAFAIPAGIFAAFLAIAGYLLQPAFGINKVAATPAWCLYSSAISTVVFVLLYWWADMRKHSLAFLVPAGANPLLAYILPDIFYAVVGILAVPYFAPILGTGIAGIFRSLAFACIMVSATNVLTRAGVRMRL